MDNSEVLFLTKDQCKKKGNGIHLTKDQLAWLRGVVTPATPGVVPISIVSNDTNTTVSIDTTIETTQLPQPIPVKENLYTTITINIKKTLLPKIRTFCHDTNTSIRDFFEAVIMDSHLISDVEPRENIIGRKKDHYERPIMRNTNNRQTYDEMAALGYMTRQQAANFLGVFDGIMSDYAKKGLKHIRKGRFYFFKKEDLEQYRSKLLRKKKKEL